MLLLFVPKTIFCGPSDPRLLELLDVQLLDEELLLLGCQMPNLIFPEIGYLLFVPSDFGNF